MDEDVFTNELVGECTITASLLCAETNQRKWLPLKFKGEKSGMILLETMFTPTK
jgi:hypothetical protein